MKMDDIYKEISFRFFAVRMRFIRNIKNIPWRLKLWIIDLFIQAMNVFFPYCDKCMNTTNYWVKCKPYIGHPHSSDWKWMGKKNCYKKGFHRT